MTTDVDITITPSEGASGAWSEVPAGAHNAIVATIEDAGISQMYPESGPQLKIGFELPDFADENGAPVVLNRWVTQKMASEPKKSNLWKLAEACGLAPSMSEPFAVSRLRHGECVVVVEIKNGGTEKERPGITGFLPRAKAQAARKAPLAQRLAPAATADDIGLCVVCDAPGTAFTNKGKVVCEGHAAVG